MIDIRPLEDTATSEVLESPQDQGDQNYIFVQTLHIFP